MCLSERFCLGLSENSNIINVIKFHIFYYKLYTLYAYIKTSVIQNLSYTCFQKKRMFLRHEHDDAMKLYVVTFLIKSSFESAQWSEQFAQKLGLWLDFIGFIAGYISYRRLAVKCGISKSTAHRICTNKKKVIKTAKKCGRPAFTQ